MNNIKKYTEFNKVNESSIDDDIAFKIDKCECVDEFYAEVYPLIENLREKIKNEIPEFDEGNTDHEMAFDMTVQNVISSYFTH